jgi:hypothetical protein
MSGVDFEPEDISTAKSCFFYKNLQEQIITNPVNQENIMFDLRQDTIDFKKVYTNKIVNIARFNTKLAETNLKILHGILPCNKNLMRWKKRDNDCCSLCNMEDTIRHMLYDCKYAKPVWGFVNNILGMNLTYHDVLLGETLNTEDNFTVSLVCYFIYKEWLLLSLDSKDRAGIGSFKNFVPDLYKWLNVYKVMRKENICVAINRLIL